MALEYYQKNGLCLKIAEESVMVVTAVEMKSYHREGETVEAIFEYLGYVASDFLEVTIKEYDAAVKSFSDNLPF